MTKWVESEYSEGTAQRAASCPGKDVAELRRVHHVIQNGLQLKTHKLSISGIFHIMFLDQVTETTESETVNKGNYCNYFDNFFSNSVYSSKTPES